MPQMGLLVIDAHPLVGSIPYLAIAALCIHALHDIVHTIIDKRLAVEILMAHKLQGMLHWNSHIHTSRIGTHPKVAKMVLAKGIDAIAMQYILRSAIRIQKQIRLTGLLVVGIDTCSIHRHQDGGCTVGDNGTDRNERNIC